MIRHLVVESLTALAIQLEAAGDETMPLILAGIAHVQHSETERERLWADCYDDARRLREVRMFGNEDVWHDKDGRLLDDDAAEAVALQELTDSIELLFDAPARLAVAS